MQIYIATHKPAPFPDDPGYIPIQNGKAVSDVDLNIVGDNTGKNISEKMPIYSECCTLYWIVENVQADLIGLAHYRRYFTPVRNSVRVADHDVAASTDFPEMRSADLIISKPFDFGQLSVAEQYATAHHERDLAIARGAVRKVSPDYLASFDAIMNGPYLTPFNLFVGRLPVLKEYSRWLFDVLFLIEEWVPYKEYPPYQQRVCAFLSERLFTVWLHRNQGRLNVLTRAVMSLPL